MAMLRLLVLKLENMLFNISADPGEKTNLADKHPDILIRLRQLHDEHLN